MKTCEENKKIHVQEAQEKAQARLQKKTQKKLFSICKMWGIKTDMVSEQKGSKLFLIVGKRLK